MLDLKVAALSHDSFILTNPPGSGAYSDNGDPFLELLKGFTGSNFLGDIKPLF